MRQIETRLSRLEKTAPDDDPLGLKKMTDDELQHFCRDLWASVLGSEDCAEMHAKARENLEKMDREARNWAEFYGRPDVAAACPKNRAN